MMTSTLTFILCLGLPGTDLSQSSSITQPTAPLAVRCQRMLDLQITLHNGTSDWHRLSTARCQSPSENHRFSVRLVGQQRAIIAEATAAIDMLRLQEAAAAFPEAFEELREVMRSVHGRLARGDVGLATQAMECDIIVTLQEMIQALHTPPTR